jgi:thioredoxin 1
MNLYFWIPFGILIIVFLFAFIKRYKMIKELKDLPESDKLKILTDANFKKTISKGVTLVDFWASWCTPCKIQGPIVNEVAEVLGDEANICKMDVDANKKSPGEYSIRNIPTIIIFKNGKPVKKFVGVKTKAVLLKAINEHL